MNGKIAGGIGVGGGTEEQDCQIAEYVVSVFEQETKTIPGKTTVWQGG